MSTSYNENDNNKGNKKIDALSWGEPTVTSTDLSRFTQNVSDAYVNTHLCARGSTVTSEIKNDLSAFYSVTDETLKRYIVRSIAAHKNTISSTRDMSKTDDYYISYNRGGDSSHNSNNEQ